MKREAFRRVTSVRGFRTSTEFEWPLVEMGDVVTLHYGKALTEVVRSPGSVPVYGTNGQTGWHDTALACGPTVILGRKGMGNLGVEWCEGAFWVIDTAYYTSFREDVLPRFFYYFTHYVGLNHLKDGTSNPSLSRDTFARQWFPLPPIDEQQRISSLLGALDDKIGLTRRMNETLEAMARAIFKSWFVDFDPVRAKSEGRRPLDASTENTALFPDSFQNPPLNEIPSGWRMGRVGDLISLSREAVNPGDFPNELFNLYSIPAFDDGRWPKEENGADIKSNKFVVPVNAVLLSKLNPRIRRVWLPFPRSGHRSVASTEFLVTLPLHGYSREFLYGFFNSESFLDNFTTLVTGTSGSHQRVQPEYLLGMDVVIPPMECVNAFTYAVKPIYELVATNLEQSQTLASIRDALLPKLVSGEIRLPHA